MRSPRFHIMVCYATRHAVRISAVVFVALQAQIFPKLCELPNLLSGVNL